MPVDDHDDDGWQEYKDDLAMGYINEDGSYREPEPDWDLYEHGKHLDDAHGGGPCTCPLPAPEEIKAQWDAELAAHEAEAHEGGKCDCESPF